MEYLGHQVDREGIRPLLACVAAIQSYPCPSTVQELQSFLGMVNFYRRFIRGAAGILKPLTDSLSGLSKSATLAWSSAMQAAFVTCKESLAAATVLSHPAADAGLVLAVDALSSHVGAVLQQHDSRGALQPLGFFSSKLTSAQVKYSTFDRELLACFLAIRHFRWCLEGCTFSMLTDHKPLTFALHRLSDAWTARQQRQLAYIAEFTSDVRPVAGTENVVASALSCPAASVLPAEGGHVDLKRLAGEQSSCEETQLFKDHDNVQEVQLGALTLVCDSSTGSLRPVVPTSMRRAVFNSVHALAHSGTRATRRMITSRFVWPSCAADIAAWCKDCQSCGRGKVTQQAHASVEAIPIPTQKFSHVHLDLVGPLPASKRHKLIVGDQHHDFIFCDQCYNFFEI